MLGDSGYYVLRHGPGCPESPARSHAIAAIEIERDRQEAKCAAKRAEGQQWHSCASPLISNEAKLAVLGEEFGEVCREIGDARAEHREPTENLRVELVQVAAVALAWIEALS